MSEEIRSFESAFESDPVSVFGRDRECAKWCPGCERYVPMVMTLTAATLAKTNIAEIFRRAETGELHFQVTAKGTLLICLNSLLATSREPPS